MALFSKKTELELVLEGRQVVAGQTVHAQVSTGEPDGKIHCSRLELLYRNTYRVEVPDGVSKGTKDVIVESHPLPGGVTGNHSVELTVPSNAPGSSAGSVEWMVRAAKDRRMARDLSRTVPITVLVPAEPLAAWAERAPTDASGSTIMTIDVTPRTAMSGTVISGRLEVRAVATNKARAVRVQLRRQRNYHRHRFSEYDFELTDELTDEKVVIERVLADDLVLPRGHRARGTSPWRCPRAFRHPTRPATTASTGTSRACWTAGSRSPRPRESRSSCTRSSAPNPKFADPSPDAGHRRCTPEIVTNS